jgi:hypothetical protein
LHIIEFKDTRTRDLPIVLNYKELRIVFFVSETRFVSHLRSVCSLSCCNSLAHLLIHDKQCHSDVSFNLIRQVEFIMAVGVPVIEIVSSAHPLRDLCQQRPLRLGEVRNHSESVMSIGYSIHQERCDFGKDLNVFEGIHDFNSLM